MRINASRQAVLNTNELLENILVFLPPTQLFADQRVCKQWRDVIASCPEIQRSMFLRVEEVPPQIWGFKVDYSSRDPSKYYELRKFNNSPPSLPWRWVTPVILSPHLTRVTYDGENEAKASVTIDLPNNVPIGKHSSILDTYISNPPCYKFAFGFDFKFEPPIPGYGCLYVSAVQFQTGKALKLGEALDKAMAVRTDADLYTADLRDNSVKGKTYRNIAASQVINRLQLEYGCTTILCQSSLMVLENVFVPNERQQAEVDAA